MLARLADAQLASLYSAMEIHPLRRRAHLSYAKFAGAKAAFVWNGRYRITAVTPQGAIITLGNLGAGDGFGFAFGILQLSPQDNLRIVADEAGHLLFAPAETLLAIGRSDISFLEALVRYFAAHATASASRLYERAALSVGARLKAELLAMCAQAPDGAQSWAINPAPTHAALGAQIGATREAVTRHLLEMEAEGLIACRRSVIEITHLQKLKRLARAPAGRHLFTPASVAGE